MKLLVVSHACVTAVNQGFFADLESETGWTDSLVMPSTWKTEYGLKDGTERWPGFKGKVHTFGVLRAGDVPRHLYRSFLVSLLRRENPQAIYVHHEPYGFATAQVYLANAIVGAKPIGFYAAQNILKQYPLPVRWAEQQVFARSSFAFPVTQSALDVLRAKGYAGPAEVLPLAVNAAVYKPSPEWRQQKRHELGISGSCFVVGYVGRLVEEKGLDLLLDALAAADEELSWNLVLVGNGAGEHALRERVVAQGFERKVHFIGYVPHEETPKWLSLFDVLALPSQTRPSWKEQFGRVLVEAMACGTPVIGSDSGEIPNVIQSTGGGLIFPERDRQALTATITSLARWPHLRNQLVQLGARAVHDRYDQKSLARRFASTIQNSMQPAANALSALPQNV